MWNLIFITSLGSSAGTFLGSRPGLYTGFGYMILVCLALGGTHVSSMGRFYGVIVKE